MRQLSADIHREQIMTKSEAMTLEDCRQKLFRVAMIYSMGRFREIFESQSKISEQEYDEHLFGAALCTNTFSVVQRYVAKNTKLLPQLEAFTGSSLFASVVDLAVWYGDENLLELLITSETSALHRRVRAMLLVSAALAGYMDKVRFLYNFKKEEEPWEFGRQSSVHTHEIRALYEAVETTHLETFKFIDYLREQYPKWPNYGDDLERKLVRCAQAGDLEGVAYLLSKGADARGGESMHHPFITNNPVIHACQSSRGSKDVVMLLIKHGADPNVTIASAVSRGRTALARQLLDRGIAPVPADWSTNFHGKF
jgi:hypothetical protein